VTALGGGDVLSILAAQCMVPGQIDLEVAWSRIEEPRRRSVKSLQQIGWGFADRRFEL